MSKCLIYIFQPVKLQIAECRVQLIPQDDSHIFLKEPAVLGSCQRIVVGFAVQVAGIALFICNINHDMYKGGALFPFHRKRCDTVGCTSLALHLPYLILLPAVPVQQIGMERKTAFACLTEGTVNPS